jgi:hypothetical protein
MGYGLVSWICWPLVHTTRNTIANLHTSQIIAAPTKFLQPAVFTNSHSLATASNSWDSSASNAYVVTVQRLSRNWTLFKCKLNYSAIFFQPSLQSSIQLPTLTNWVPGWRLFHTILLAFSSQADIRVTIDNWTSYLTSLDWTALSRPEVHLGAVPTENTPLPL